ncbi:MAG: hypothetical protein JWN71_1838 [Xanthobacteraceae bacterium]|jgi:O-antigen/teichoic acid export membrane protein|nr:hypothetical protein [Xanthobacteraceae bacterium]
MYGPQQGAFSGPKTVRSRAPALLSSAWGTARRWKGRILLAIVDQGAASTANFALTIFYAVYLPLDSFGRYVIVWSISLLIENAQVSLILDSMPAIVSRYGRHSRQRLDVAGTWVVMLYGGISSLLILAIVPIAELWSPYFAMPLLCLAAVNPFQRLYIYLRRLCYIRDRQDAAATASVIYGVTLLGGACTLLLLGRMSVESVVLLWGVANGVAVLTIGLMGVVCFRRPMPATIVWLIRRLWSTGRWLAGAAIGFWITTWGMFPIIAAIAGTEVAGIIRALQNLFTPIVQFNAALNLAILPRVADKVAAGGQHLARSFAIQATVGFTTIVVVYAGLVMLGSHRLLALIYHKPEIVNAAYLLWPLGLAMIIESARQGSSMALLSVNRTRMFFMSRVAGVSVFLIGVLILGHLLGAQGILWANVVAHAVGTGLLLREALSLQRSATSLPVADAALSEPSAGAAKSTA